MTVTTMLPNFNVRRTRTGLVLSTPPDQLTDFDPFEDWHEDFPEHLELEGEKWARKVLPLRRDANWRNAPNLGGPVMGPTAAQED